MSDDTPATWWPRWRLEPVIDPELPATKQYELLDALGQQTVPGRRGRRARELAIALRDSYVQPNSDLDDQARQTYWRVMDAIDAAQAAADSEAVDGIEARIVLCSERWGIASKLAAQTRQRQANAASGITRDRDLAKAVAATNRRAYKVITYVQELTRLAQTARRREQGAAIAEQRLDAVAGTEADSLSVSQLEEMADRARDLTRTLGVPVSASQARQAFRRLTALGGQARRAFHPGSQSGS